MHHMYQYSLPFFVSKFDEAMHNVDGEIFSLGASGFEREPADVEKQPSEEAVQFRTGTARSSDLVRSITYGIYSTVIRSLFSCDEAVFRLLLAIKVSVADYDNIRPEELRLLVRGGDGMQTTDKASPLFRRLSLWMTREQCECAALLSCLPTLGERFENSILNHEKAWRAWVGKSTPESIPLPDPNFASGLSSFHKLLVIRCLRPDRIVSVSEKYVRNTLGPQYVSAPHMSLDVLLTEPDASARKPIIFLVKDGDPTSRVEELAHAHRAVLHTLSMGQGQSIRARTLIQRLSSSRVRKQLNPHNALESLYTGASASSAGTGGLSRQVSTADESEISQGTEDDLKNEPPQWVLLQNCHLSVEFMKELDTILRSVFITSRNAKFRLWLTTAPNPDFPASLLQNSFLVAVDQTMGFRQHLAQQYQIASQSVVESIKRKEWKPLLFAVCYMHVALVHRSSYGRLGWNRHYDFTDEDMHASINHLRKCLYNVDMKTPLRWSSLQYMVCEIMYGGRVTDEQDRQLLSLLGRRWLNQLITSPTFNLSDSCLTDGSRRSIGIPNFENEESILRYINKYVPDEAEPNMLCLPSTAGHIQTATVARKVIHSLGLLFPRNNSSSSSSGGGGDSGGFVLDSSGSNMSRSSSGNDERVSLTLSSFLETWPQRLSPVLLQELLDGLGGCNHDHPLNSFLRQELSTFWTSMDSIRETMKDCLSALQGESLMTEAIERICASILAGCVPKGWADATVQSPSLTSWLEIITRRNRQYVSWLKNGRPAVFWIGGFSNVRAFLTAVRQEVSRSMLQESSDHTVDTVQLVATVTKFDGVQKVARAPPSIGVYVDGICLEGAEWHSLYKKVLPCSGRRISSALPVLHIFPASNDLLAELSPPLGSVDYKPHSKYVLSCPVYHLNIRGDDNFLLPLALYCEGDPEQWSRQGVAATCLDVV